MPHAYLVRYALMRYVGQFAADSGEYTRGQRVVVQTRRGQELGEVLLEVPERPFPSNLVESRVLRQADGADLERARLAERDRPRRLALCEHELQQGVWPLVVVDAEPLLDETRTVLYYLGPHRLDDAGLRQVLREATGLDVILEPVGCDEPAESAEGDDGGETHGCGTCGSGGGCGSGEGARGGCGSSASADSHAGGCSSCAVKDLLIKARG